MIQETAWIWLPILLWFGVRYVLLWVLDQTQEWYLNLIMLIQARHKLEQNAKKQVKKEYLIKGILILAVNFIVLMFVGFIWFAVPTIYFFGTKIPSWLYIISLFMLKIGVSWLFAKKPQ